MGYNTVAVILNDRQHDIERDGPIGARLAQAMRAWFAGPREGRWLDMNFGAGQVVSQAHADHEQLVVVCRNGGQLLNDANDLSRISCEVLKECLERHGYKVTKTRKSKAPPATPEPSL